MSRVAQVLGVTHPIIQGAMGVICNPELVAAVSEAGGFGLLSTSFAGDPEEVRSQVRAVRALTDKPFGANLFAMNPRVLDFAEVLAEEGVPAVTISGGSPKQIVPLCREKEMKTIIVAPTVDAAVKAEALGADAIVAEGSESGGVQGFQGVSTMVLVPAVVDAVRIPVIAAGGIGDSRGYRASFALGAQGVQVGTRFIATQECAAHTKYKETILATGEAQTELINFGRFRLRALPTPLVEKTRSGEAVDMSWFAGGALERSWLSGDLEAGFLPAGQICGLIRSVPTVREIIAEMVG